MSDQYTAFADERILASGSAAVVALAVKAAPDGPHRILTFDTQSARVIDLDLRGSDEEIALRYAGQAEGEPRGRGRPKLGVVAREVTLLPRHWEWLSTQQGGASVALRRLVDEARRAEGDAPTTKARQEAAYRFMMAMAGNQLYLEEALRALFAGDRAKLETLTANWPQDIRNFAIGLAYGH